MPDPTGPGPARVDDTTAFIDAVLTARSQAELAAINSNLLGGGGSSASEKLSEINDTLWDLVDLYVPNAQEALDRYELLMTSTPPPDPLGGTSTGTPRPAPHVTPALPSADLDDAIYLIQQALTRNNPRAAFAAEPLASDPARALGFKGSELVDYLRVSVDKDEVFELLDYERNGVMAEIQSRGLLGNPVDINCLAKVHDILKTARSRAYTEIHECLKDPPLDAPTAVFYLDSALSLARPTDVFKSQPTIRDDPTLLLGFCHNDLAELAKTEKDKAYGKLDYNATSLMDEIRRLRPDLAANPDLEKLLRLAQEKAAILLDKSLGVEPRRPEASPFTKAWHAAGRVLLTGVFAGAATGVLLIAWQTLAASTLTGDALANYLIVRNAAAPKMFFGLWALFNLKSALGLVFGRKRRR